MIDFKMTDLDGRWRHITIPVERFDDDIFVYGIGFDGSNYGYAPLEKSDMVFIPDPATAVVDPFMPVPWKLRPVRGFWNSLSLSRASRTLLLTSMVFMV